MFLNNFILSMDFIEFNDLSREWSGGEIRNNVSQKGVAWCLKNKGDVGAHIFPLTYGRQSTVDALL